MTTKFSYLYLTCDDKQKKQIAKKLLEKRLIACAKFVPVAAMYWWQGKIEEASEALLLMEAPTANFAAIEAEVAKIHEYDTFVLTQVPMTDINDDAKSWIEKETT